MKSLNISDALYNTIRRLAYENDRAVDEYAEELIATMLPVARKAPKAKREIMAELRDRRRAEQYGADWRTNLCEHCGGELPTYHLPNTHYCTDRCRQAAYRARKAITAPLSG